MIDGLAHFPQIPPQFHLLGSSDLYAGQRKSHGGQEHEDGNRRHQLDKRKTCRPEPESCHPERSEGALQLLVNRRA
jgi:hypothetical protein